MQIRLSATIGAGALLAAAAAAQLPSVIPDRYATTEGPGNSEAPGDWSPVHMQVIYAKSGIRSGTATFRGVRFRRDGSNTRFFAHTETVEIAVSSRGVPSPEFSHSVYATNRGSDHATVFSGRFSFPAIQGGPGPRPFTLDFPFRSPFAYATGNHLLVEILVRANTFSPSGWKVDATPGQVVSPSGSVRDVGVGCPTGFAATVQGVVPWPGAPLIVRGASGAAQGLGAFTALGVANRLVRLDPLGAPGCTLYQDVLLQFPGTVGPGGLLVADFGRLPQNPGLAGASVRMQQFVADPSFNALGLRASQSIAITIGRGFPAGLEAHAWYDRRPNTISTFPQADFRSTRAPIIQVY